MAYTSLQITPTSLQELLQSSGQEVQGGALLVGFVEGKSCEFDGRKKKNFFHGKITGKSWVSGQDVPFNQSNDSRGLLLCTTILTQKTQVEKVTRNVIRSFPRGNPWISIVNHRIWECCVTIRISHWIPIKSPCSEMNPLTWSDWKWDIPQKNHQPIPILIVWPSGYLT